MSDIKLGGGPEGPLITVGIDDNGRPNAELAADAFVHVTPSGSFTAWRKGGMRVWGREVANADSPEFVSVAQLLRESMPVDDPRWRDGAHYEESPWPDYVALGWPDPDLGDYRIRQEDALASGYFVPAMGESEHVKSTAPGGSRHRHE